MRMLASLIATLAFAVTVHAQGKGLVVHEWGVFRVNTDSDFANADIRQEWDELPGFAYGAIKGRVVPQHWGAAEFRRQPIIFFHTEQPLTAKVRVDFPGGQAGVWFPATFNPAVEGQQHQPKSSTRLEWELGIKTCPQNWQPKNPNYSPIREDHWVARTRLVKCDDVYSHYGPRATDTEREKFVYYDGVFPQGKWLKIDVAGDAVTLSSQVKRPVFDVTVVDRRDDDKVRIGRIDTLKAGERDRKVEFATVDAAGFSKDAGDILLKQLVAAGLFEDEAKTLVDLWRKDMFETPGLNLFYRLTQEEYDIRLPLTVEPKPEKTVRVGLVYHGHLEPDFAERVLELVKQLDSPRFAVRDAATKKIQQIGPAAMVQLMRIRDKQKDLSAEVKQRLDHLISRWNVKDAFDQ